MKETNCVVVACPLGAELLVPEEVGDRCRDVAEVWDEASKVPSQPEETAHLANRPRFFQLLDRFHFGRCRSDAISTDHDAQELDFWEAELALKEVAGVVVGDEDQEDSSEERYVLFVCLRVEDDVVPVSYTHLTLPTILLV